MKYELDKESGYLKVDRPQRFSNICPMPYGFVPQTLCAEKVGGYCMEKTGRTGIKGDNDPLDICVITERNIPHGNLILDEIALVVLMMNDREDDDYKIIAVLGGYAVSGHMRDISEVPDHMVKRLSHYFHTYNERPFSNDEKECEITHIDDREEAMEVINRSSEDYNGRFDMDKRELCKMIGTALQPPERL